MLPAPSQGAIMVVCREEDKEAFDVCNTLNHADTALCTKIEKDFLRTLMGGCSTPISALAVIKENMLHFRGNIFSPDGKEKAEVEKIILADKAQQTGIEAAQEILNNGAREISHAIRNAKS